MKIALLLASLEEGGLENHVVDLANGLVEHGDAVTLLSDPKFFDRCAPGVVGTAIDASASRHNLLNRARTRAAILASGAQIVHAHAGKAAAILAQSAKALKKAGVRTVSTIHGLKGSLKNYASCDHVIGVSHGVVERLPSGTPSTVVYNGVSAPPDVERSHDELATLLGADASRPISIAVGRLVPVKGYDRLIDAWQDAFGTLAIMGEGPQETALREQARGKSIVFTGYRSDVRSWYSGADLMVSRRTAKVSPTRWPRLCAPDCRSSRPRYPAHARSCHQSCSRAPRPRRDHRQRVARSRSHARLVAPRLRLGRPDPDRGCDGELRTRGLLEADGRWLKITRATANRSRY